MRRLVSLTFALAFALPAQDAFHTVALRDLVKDEALGEERWGNWRLRESRLPYAILEGPGEVYVQLGEHVGWASAREVLGSAVVCVRAPKGTRVRAFVPRADWSGMIEVPFLLEAQHAGAEAKTAFLQAREAALRRLLERGVPGTAWFRHRHQLAAEELGTDARPGEAQVPRPGELEDTIGLFTGGRAIAENLQLDRILRAAADGGVEEVDVATLPGIDVKALDWTKDLVGKSPDLDPLALRIPHDQHALFFPSFEALVTLADEAERYGTPVLQTLEPRAEDAQVAQRYQRQLCLSTTGIGRLLGPHLIQSVAITGADPYLRVGADVAVVFAAKDAAALKNLLVARLELVRKDEPLAKKVEGSVAGIAYAGLRSLDRRICSYVAASDDVVVVTNSLEQLRRLAELWTTHGSSLAGLPEFAFFRDRYKRSEPETAFLFLSDATIRRWCSAEWRIADSRRTRVAAVLTDLQARHVRDVAAGVREPKPLAAEAGGLDLGALRLTPAGVESGLYGNLEFMTPILELPRARVTKAEADAYGSWRESYQRNWRQYFDPIGIRFAVGKDELAADVTVMPLIFATEYDEWVQVSRGAKIAPAAVDAHEALAIFALALDPGSKPMRKVARLAGEMAPKPVDILGWLGSTLSVHADADPFWQELEQAARPDEFLEKNWPRLPLLVRIEVKDSLKLTVFLAALRAFADQTAPGLSEWETLTHAGLPYVKVKPSEEARAGDRDFAICYAPGADALLITLNEPMLQRALARKAARKDAAAQSRPAPNVGPALLGENVCLQVDARFVEPWRRALREEQDQQLQALCWANLPALNEWRRMFPDADPVVMHERLWQTKLICPAGGKYAWNDKLGTMESTVLGCPAGPKPPPGGFAVLQGLRGGNFGLTFERDGVRARLVITRAR